MSSIDHGSKWLRTLTLGFVVSGGLIAAAGAAHAATIVVRANGPSAGSYPPGTKLPENGSIVLKPGDSVTVLDAHGTRVLHGGNAPGQVPVAGNGTKTVNGISALLADNGLRQTRTGATRGIATPPRPTNLWMVDTTRGGPFCVVNAKALALWRPSNAADATLTLSSSGGKTTAPVAFMTGQAVRPWPVDTIAIANGAKVQLAGIAANPVTIELKLLPTVPQTLDDAAAALLAQGCTAQVDLLADATNLDNAD